jgi:hypothetical protein
MTSVSLSISFEKFNIIAQSGNWMHTITATSEGLVKARIIGLLERNIAYNPEMSGWFPFIPEKLTGVKERIALSLLLTYPNRVTRSILSGISSVKPVSLRKYLTEEGKGVSLHIDEIEEGIILNPLGCVWAFQILDSIENKEVNLADG